MQKDFSQALLNADNPIPDGVVGPTGGPSQKRFGVYRNNVVVSLIEALKAAYPTVQKIVGTEFFDAMAGVYVRDHPPTSPLMMFFGEQFPQFLERFEPVKNLPYLPDLARLERARREAYHSADAAPCAAEKLGEIPPEKLGEVRLKLHPSVRIVASEHPVFSIWRFNNIEQQKIVVPKEDVLICRPDMTVEMRVLPSGAQIFLSNLQAGQTLGTAATTAAESCDDFDLSVNLGGIFEASILVDIH